MRRSGVRFLFPAPGIPVKSPARKAGLFRLVSSCSSAASAFNVIADFNCAALGIDRDRGLLTPGTRHQGSSPNQQVAGVRLETPLPHSAASIVFKSAITSRADRANASFAASIFESIQVRTSSSSFRFSSLRLALSGICNTSATLP